MEEAEQEVLRRRRRTIVFFEDADTPARRYTAQDAGRRNELAGIASKEEDLAGRRVGNFLRYFVLLAACAIAIASIVAGDSLTRLYCQTAPFASNECAAPLVKQREPLLCYVEAGMTPLTKTLRAVNELNQRSIQLEFVGLAMHTAITDMKALRGMQQLHNTSNDATLADLLNTSAKAYGIVQQFSGDDYRYRHHVFGVAGVGHMSLALSQLQGIDNAPESRQSLSDQSSHASLAHNLTRSYLLLFEDQLAPAKELVMMTSESTLVLGILLGQLGVHEKLLKGPDDDSRYGDTSQQLRLSGRIRDAVVWSQMAMDSAETMYKNLYTEVLSTLKMLKNGYALDHAMHVDTAIRVVQTILDLETAQISQHADQSDIMESVTDEILGQLMEGEESDGVMRKLGQAMARGKYNWW